MGQALRMQFMALGDVLARQGDWVERVLGVTLFGADAAPQALCAQGVPVVRVQAPVAGARQPACEVWLADRAVRSGRSARARWRATESVMFVAPDIDPDAALEAGAEAAYTALFDAVEAAGYPHLLRVWNHIGDINGDDAGLERYRRFNIGRQQAFLARRRQVAGAGVPAASALGARADAPLCVYALAARAAPHGIENPRQISAYHYPADYGPRAPTFSRANLLGGDAPVLFVSGTASIVGHQSLHPGDVREQTRETLRNIAALLEVGRAEHGLRLALADLQFKVYLRDAAHRDAVHEELAGVIGALPDALFLQADICRQELLVEIEAVAVPERERACAA